jgi:integrase
MAPPKLTTPNYRLFKRGPRFYVRWWEGGAWKRVSTGTEDRGEAQRFLAQLIAGIGTPEPPKAPSIAEMMTGYLDDRRPVVSAFDTLEAAAKPLVRHLGDLQPNHLTKERIRRYHRLRREEGHWVGPPRSRRKKPTADGTIIRELVTLRAALQWAKKARWISGDLPYIEVPSQPPARDRWLTRAEADRLLASAQALHVKTFIALALHTAARSAAILELTWQQVNLETGILHLGEGHGNKRRGIVPINDALRPYLEQASKAATCPYVVEHGSSRVGSIKTGFKAAARRACVAGISPHTLRHTAVTWMVMGGVPMPMVARYAAMSLQMVENRYGHHSADWLKQAADALSGPTTRKISIPDSLAPLSGLSIAQIAPVRDDDANNINARA